MNEESNSVISRLDLETILGVMFATNEGILLLWGGPDKLLSAYIFVRIQSLKSHTDIVGHGTMF